MSDRTGRTDVESAIDKLNLAARDLGLRRTFSVRYGSASMGVSHVLEEESPDLAHPTLTKIGTAYVSAFTYVTAMVHALTSVLWERREESFPIRRVPTDAISSLAYDPDSRTARRGGDPAR